VIKISRGKLIIFGNRSGDQFTDQLIKEINIIQENFIENKDKINDKKDFINTIRNIVSEPIVKGKIEIIDFADGEIKPMIKESVRGADVFIVQNCFDPLSQRSIQDNLFESFLTIDAVRRAGAKHISLVFPFHPYLRQDKQKRREPISARLVSDFICTAGADSVITAEMHKEQIGGFYKKTLIDNLNTTKLISDYIKNNYDLTNFIIMAPDAGASEKTGEYAKSLGLKAIQGFKTRSHTQANVVKTLMIVGDVKDKNILITDDMIDTAGTIEKIYYELKNKGAKKIVIAATHGLLNDPAIKILSKMDADIIITDTIYHGEDFLKNNTNFKIVTTAKLFAEVIYNINIDQSVSDIYH